MYSGKRVLSFRRQKFTTVSTASYKPGALTKAQPCGRMVPFIFIYSKNFKRSFMAHINVPEGIPGIRSLVMFRPESGKHLYDLAQVLLRGGDSPLTEAERELIATHVSNRNNCMFCRDSHAAAARCLLGDGASIVDDVISDANTADVSPKMRALLHIAGKVQILGKEIKPDDIEAARTVGANDRDIHDTVLIAATFSMFNRYVDGLASLTPADPDAYAEMGERMATKGYAMPAPLTTPR
jgi:uncharacterized peroxidase-related enzyme